ncbi:MAG: hypothetical protein P8N43_05235 [Alphaproteobacteria bacterium]|nr:hypothetical protein [Alphaproteobacteria bacterium]
MTTPFEKITPAYFEHMISGMNGDGVAEDFTRLLERSCSWVAARFFSARA